MSKAAFDSWKIIRSSLFRLVYPTGSLVVTPDISGTKTWQPTSYIKHAYSPPYRGGHSIWRAATCPLRHGGAFSITHDPQPPHPDLRRSSSLPPRSPAISVRCLGSGRWPGTATTTDHYFPVDARPLPFFTKPPNVDRLVFTLNGNTRSPTMPSSNLTKAGKNQGRSQPKAQALSSPVRRTGRAGA